MPLHEVKGNQRQMIVKPEDVRVQSVRVDESQESVPLKKKLNLRLKNKKSAPNPRSHCFSCPQLQMKDWCVFLFGEYFSVDHFQFDVSRSEYWFRKRKIKCLIIMQNNNYANMLL